MTTEESLHRFMAVSWLYLRLTEKSSDYLGAAELEELIAIINAENEPQMCPDQMFA